MKFSLTKELETVLKTVISLNKRDFPISVKDGYMLAQTDRGNIKVALGENNSLLGDEERYEGLQTICSNIFLRSPQALT